MSNVGGGYGYSNWHPFGLGLLGGAILGPVLIFILVWTIYWKYKALWRAAKQDQKWWFLVLLVVNTIGILEILYIYFFSKKLTNNDIKN
jgi:methionyl-tRNA synthetase